MRDEDVRCKSGFRSLLPRSLALLWGYKLLLTYALLTLLSSAMSCALLKDNVILCHSGGTLGLHHSKTLVNEDGLVVLLELGKG